MDHRATRAWSRWGVQLLLAAFIAGGFAAWAFALAAPMAAQPSPSWALAAWLLNAVEDPSVHITGTLEAHAAVNTPGRVTVLLLGIDRRPVQDRDAPALTDSIMLLSVDTANRTAAMLSVPRDLWLPMPLSDDRVLHDRINAAYAYGETLGYPGGGPALARATLEYNLGVRIHHHVLVDFQTFERFIDAIGGVEMTLDEPLVDPSFPTDDFGVRAIRLPAGTHRLSGEQALWVARSRRQSSDFGRMERQQRLVMAVRDQVLRLDILPRVPQLYMEYRDAVRTSLSPGEAVQLARAAAEVPPERMRSGVIDQRHVRRATIAGDPFVLLPDRTRIAALVAEVFAGTAAD